MIDTWSNALNRFTRNTDLFSRKNKVYNLHGCPLKCAGAHRPPDSVIEETKNKTYNLSGIGGLLFETIAIKMNFTPVISRVVDVTSNYDPVFANDSSTLSIDVGSKKVDIAFGIFSRLLDFHPKISFVMETNMDCFTWAVPPNAGVGPSMWTTYVGEFSWITWVLIICFLISVIPVFYFLTYLAFNEDNNFKEWGFLSFFVYFTFLGASVEEKPHSNVLRVFLAPWLFYCLVLGAAYNAQLGSFATVPTKVGNIENPADLLKTSFGITGAPQMFHVLNASINTSDVIRSLLKRFEVLPPGNFLPVIEKVVTDRNLAVFSTKSLLAYSNEKLKARNMPTSYLQPSCVIKSPSSPMIVPRVSPLLEPLSGIIHRLFEAGILSRWESEAKQRNKRDSFQLEPKLYLQQMQGAFLLLISGLMLSVAVFIAEVVTYRWIFPPPDLMTQLIAEGYKIPFTK
ncbi:ionotropic receptor 21a-like [Homalodisca vitripennis]|uniref:ionotropic receptor 21a-like n=1 Tax=Homalodisca vitripennis TaxID=197043 RepID=UPI001EEA9241|nr:ionotropic receptor 21a-like [Homalodisca vitripennis]